MIPDEEIATIKAYEFDEGSRGDVERLLDERETLVALYRTITDREGLSRRAWEQILEARQAVEDFR